MNNYLNNLFNLKDKTVIITGAVGISGTAHVKAFAECGANVVITDIEQQSEKIEKLKEEIEHKFGSRCLGLIVDVSKKEDVEKMVKDVIQEFGKIDILINNAGISGKFDESKIAPIFEDYPREAWDKAWDVNMTGMFLCAQAVGREMLKTGGGSIVNVASIHGLISPDQRVYNKGSEIKSVKPISYSVTKSAVYNFTRYLATYWGDKNIRVNTITPGGIFDNQDSDFVKAYEYRTPMGRMANTDDIIGPMLFLCSDAASYITGANLVVDGGLTIW